MKYLRIFEEYDEEPLRSHRLRMEHGYKPRYRLGMIAVRFIDSEEYGKMKYPGIEEETGSVLVDYEEIFSLKNHPYIKYFEDKYGIKRVSNPSLSVLGLSSDISDYFTYFKCNVGEEKQKMEELSKDKIVVVVDFVDMKHIIDSEKISQVGRDLILLDEDFPSHSDEQIKKIIEDSIEKLKKIIK